MYFLIIDKSAKLPLDEALIVSLTCILVVLTILAGSSLVISLMRFIPAKKEIATPTPVRNNTVKKSVNLDDLDEDMIAATMVALIDAAEDEEDATYRLSSIKKLN